MQHRNSAEEHGEACVHVLDEDIHALSSIAELVRSAGYRVSEYTSAAEFSSRFLPEGDCCVVLNLCLPDASGLETLRDLRAGHPHVPAIVMSAHADVPTAIRATRDGALDVIKKPFSPERLLARIDEALDVCHRQRDSMLQRFEVRARVDLLTRREREVLRCLCRGMSVKEIALEFGLSPKTVQIHRARVLKGMRAGSLVDLVNLLHGSVPVPGAHSSVHGSV